MINAGLGKDGGVPRRIAVAMLAPPAWAPPGVDRAAWRLALAEDLLDVLATLADVEAAVAFRTGESALRSQIGWPGLRGYELPTLDVSSVLAAVAEDGYEQAVLLAADAPDLPGMLIAKLLRPLTTRPLAAAAAAGAFDRPVGSDPPVGYDPPAGSDRSEAPVGRMAAGLLGLAARLPAPPWLPAVGLDELTPQALRRAAPRPTDLAPAPGWHRLRSPADLARLDPRLEGWDATRALLSPQDPNMVG